MTRRVEIPAHAPQVRTELLQRTAVVRRFAPAPREADDDQDRLGARGVYAQGRVRGALQPSGEIAALLARLIPAPEPGAAAPLVSAAPAPDAHGTRIVGYAATVEAPRAAPRPGEIAPRTEVPGGELPGAVQHPPAASSEAQPVQAAGPPSRAGEAVAPSEPAVGDAASSTVAAPRISGAARGSEATGAVSTEGAEPDAGAAPAAIVKRWQAGVRNAGAGVPRPRILVGDAARAHMRGIAQSARARQQAARSNVTAEAAKTAPPSPAVEPAPPPPANPVPQHTAAILKLSNQRLDDQFPPPLVPSPRREVESTFIGGTLPQLGEGPIDSQLFNVLTSADDEMRKLAKLPGPEALKSKDKTEKDQAEAMQDVLDQLSGKKPPEPRQGRGEPVITSDTGKPAPMKPLPDRRLEVPVAQVAARLLAELDDAAARVLESLRVRAFPDGVLKETFPQTGAGMADSLRAELDTEVREMVAAANVSAEDLEKMIATRRAELASAAADAAGVCKAERDAAVTDVKAEAQSTANAIDGADQAAEEALLKRQEAASGTADPAVVNRVRDRAVNWIREHVTTQITHYQKAGETRASELAQVKSAQLGAYAAQSQREQYQVLKPEEFGRAKRDPADQAREQRLADVVALIRNWLDERTAETGELFRKGMGFAAGQTRQHRGDIERAGSAGIEAARAWAEDKILEGESWWTRFLTRIRRWLAEARDLKSQWRVRRTEENRDAVANDLSLVTFVEQKLAKDATQEQILADQRLNEAQRQLIRQYFTHKEKGGHPLDFAANRLRETLAANHLEAAREVFERELIALPVHADDRDTAEKLGKLGQKLGFDAVKIAIDVHGAMDQIGTDEDLIFSSLRALTPLRGAIVRKVYYIKYGSSLDDDLDSELSGDELRRAQAQLEGQQARADAIALHDAIAGPGTDEKAIMSTLRNKTPAEVEAIRAEYLARYGETLQAALEGDLEEGNEIDQANALMAGDTATADAIAIDEAMRGGFLGLGTAEKDIEEVYTRVRSEVLARAQAEHWTAAEMEAEVRLRLGKISDKFEKRYAHVAQYNVAGLKGATALERAYRSEMSGAQLDLALALQANDHVAASAAQIELEHRGFYASDEKINAVLRSQYERELEAVRLDQAPARNMAIAREVRRLREQRPVVSEEEISKVRMKMEREAEYAMHQVALPRSKMQMKQLEEVYQSKYTWPLSFVVDWNTSGREGRSANTLLAQGGYLEPLQEIEYATEGAGTDEAALKRRLKTMTRSEILALKAQWEARHPGENFEDMLRSELSGRDLHDIMDMVNYGAPESALGQIEQQRRHAKTELTELTGSLGGAAARREAAWIEHQLAALEKLEPDLNRTDWPEGPDALRKREALQDEVAFRVQRVEDAIADHRRRLDSISDAIGMAVGIALAVVLGAISGGTLAAVIIGSLLATAATMVTKQLVLGGAYGAGDIGVDLAVGVVDVLTAGAVQKFGGRFLKPLQIALRGQAGKVGGRVAALTGVLSRSGVVQKIARFPGAQAVGQVVRRVAPSRAAIERGVAGMITESAADVAGSIPSTVTQVALTDQTWQGDPLANFLENGGMALAQSFLISRGTSAVHSVGGTVLKGARGIARSRSEVGRLHEASRLIGEGYAGFVQDNPGASIQDFLAHPEGQRVRKRINERGLLPTVEKVNRAMQAERARVKALDEAGVDPRVESPTEAQARAAELQLALPKNLRDGTFVTPDPALAGRSVLVEPLRVGNRIVGVDIRVGPDATPLDIALHAATVDAMQRYRGTLGNARRALADAFAALKGAGLKVGSRGWEAQLELAKLPGILASRMDVLPHVDLTPDAQSRIRDDVASLQAQINRHVAVLSDPVLRRAPGRGFVAAEGVAGSRADFQATPRENGVLTETGRLELDYHLERASAAFERGDMETAGQILEYAAKRLGFDVHRLREHVLTKGGIPEINAELWRGRETLEQESVGPDVSQRRRDPDQVELDEMLKSLKRRHKDAPESLIARVRRGSRKGRAAQEKINAASRAPSDAEVVNITPERLAKELEAARGPMKKPPKGERQSVDIEIDGLKLTVYRAKATKKNPHPPVLFDATLPAWQGKPVVYQFGYGELRVWQSPPTTDHPHGLMHQETVVGKGRERLGLEDRSFSQGEGDFAGPALERGHLHGAGLGVESGFGITLVPREVNQALQARGIEKYMRRLRDALPRGATLHYETTLVRHEGTSRASEITYRIDISMHGERVPFAEFGIKIETDPPATPRSKRRGTTSIEVSPLAPRYSTSRQANRLLDHWRELVDVPQQLLHGLARKRDALLALSALYERDPDDVADVIKRHPALAGHRPDPAKLNLREWKKQLRDLFQGEDPPRFVIVDLRGLNLKPAQRDSIMAAIDALPEAARLRTLVLI